MGVFATRTPHRPNPIGLTVAKVRTKLYVHGSILHSHGQYALCLSVECCQL